MATNALPACKVPGSLALGDHGKKFFVWSSTDRSTGYYSDRLVQLAKSSAKLNKAIHTVDLLEWKELDDAKEKYDWVWACPTETSVGLKLPIPVLAEFAKRCGARLMLDATASIGLEGDQYLVDVISYSSCKGLFGLTGACFVAFNDHPTQKVDSFYLDINSHLEKKMTGPYHAIASLYAMTFCLNTKISGKVLSTIKSFSSKNG